MRCSLTRLSTGQLRVSVWGADDTGMEQDFEPQDGPKAIALYEALPNPIERRWLEDKGFKPA